MRRFRAEILGIFDRWKRAEAENPHTFIPYVAGDEAERGSNAIQTVDLTSERHVRVAIRGSLPASLTQLGAFEEQIAAREPPSSFVLAFTLPGEVKVRLYKLVRPMLTFNERGRVYASLLRSEFKAIVGAPFSFDMSFSCVQVDDVLFVLRPSEFERLFAYETGVRARAVEVAARLEPYVTGETFTLLNELAERSSFAQRRMPQIERELASSPDLMGNWSRIIDDRHLRNVRVVGAGADRRLECVGKRHREIIKLMSGDYVRSEASNLKWDSSVKRAVG